MNDWELKKQNDVLGLLSSPRLDQPWTFCRFTPTVLFQEYKPFFERELQLLNTGLVAEQDMTDWEKAVDLIDSLQLILKPLDGEAVITDFLLHVDGDQAWFRS